MKVLDQFRRISRQFCLALILLLPATVLGQSEVRNDIPEPAQLSNLVAALRANRLDAEKVAAMRAAGFELIRSARYGDAWSIFSAMLESAPRDQQAMYGGALALFNLGQLRQAEELAKSAVESATNENANTGSTNSLNWRGRASDSLVLLAVILAVKRDSAGALRAAREAVDLAPGSFDAQFALGRALYGAGDPSNAARTFRKALALKPEHVEARFFLATALESAGDYNEAREAYRELIRLQPQSAQGHLGLGVLLVKLDTANAEEGVNELLKAVALNGDIYEARITLGRFLIKLGRQAEAIEHLSRAAQLAPDNPEPHYQLAIAYRRLEKSVDAEREAAKVNEINSSRRASGPKGTALSAADLPQLLARTKSYLGLQRTKDAVELADQIQALANDDPRVLYTLGLQFAEAQQYERAAILFQRTNALRPNAGEVVYNLGIALYNLDRLAEASRALESAAALMPNDPDPFYRLGLVASAQGNSSLALGYWQKTIGLRKNYAEAYFMIAEELNRNQRTNTAVEYYQKAIDYDSSKLLYYVRLGAIHFRRRHYHEARNIYERAAAKFPSSPQIHYLIGYAARAEGLYDDALNSFHRARSLQPDNVDVLANLGFINSERGNYPEAEQFLRRALTIDPKHFPANYDLGRLLVRLKRYDEALPVLERGAALSTTDPGIHYQLFTAYSRLKRKTDADRELVIFKRLEETRKNGNGPMEGSAVNEQPTPNITESRPGGSVNDKP
jgi:tetratricopeptide (TPR) repeat protein